MKRSEFIKSSAIITVAAFLSNKIFSAVGDSGFLNVLEQNKSLRPDPNNYSEPIYKAIAYGISAPNPHNTQAWKFKIINNTSMLFYVDEKRILPKTDPPTRQIHIGTGCFLAYLEIGMKKEGYDTSIQLLPEGDYALSEIGKKPVAKVELKTAQPSEDKLYSQLFIRQTNRTIYKGDMIKKEEFDQLVADAGILNYSATFINAKPLFTQVSDLFYRAMQQETNDYDAYDESRVWLRVKDDIEKKRDGLNMRVNGMSGTQLKIVENMFKDYSPQAWHALNSKNVYLRNFSDVIDSSKGYILWTTASNKTTDWILCGKDYARMQLSAQLNKFYFHPLNQIIQEYASMKPLYDEFNTLVKVMEPAKVQMIVRMGRGQEVPYSHRRELNDLISQ